MKISDNPNDRLRGQKSSVERFKEAVKKREVKKDINEDTDAAFWGDDVPPQADTEAIFNKVSIEQKKQQQKYGYKKSDPNRKVKVKEVKDISLFEEDVFNDDMPTPEAVEPRLKLKKTPKFVPPANFITDHTPEEKLPCLDTDEVITLSNSIPELKAIVPTKPLPTPKPVVSEDLGDLGDVKSKRDLMNIATFLLKQNIAPSCFKTHNEIFIALQTVFSLGIKNPGEMLLALNNMYLINNKIELFGDLPLALVKRFGDLVKIEEFFVDNKHEKICMDNKNLNNLPMAAVCNLTNSLGDKTEFYLTENDLKLSGGIRNTDGSWNMRGSATWKRYPKIHWARRLRGWALKSSYPHVLKGVGIQEYDNSVPLQKVAGKQDAYTVMEEKYTDVKKD